MNILSVPIWIRVSAECGSPKLAPHDVAAWLRRHQKNGASARTTRYARSVLRAALNQALRWELVLRNAAALTDPPRYRARGDPAADARSG